MRIGRPYRLTAAPVGEFTWRMQFTAPAEHYDRFMGRYVPRLAVALADAAGVAARDARARRRLRARAG